ncbi:AAA family ATPase [Providencia rettgeri]|uniref:AAA family ATPase n=1 Tax=Providencia rettgeri TaxID=587 RepID=A0A939NH48_PRORE|nr:AAA family ATPase [Providencia rettgeri]
MGKWCYKPFSSREKIAYRRIEPEQLFGYVTPSLNLVPGLLHQINGGILVIAASTLINQPLMWARLKIWLTVNSLNGYLIRIINLYPLKLSHSL